MEMERDERTEDREGCIETSRHKGKERRKGKEERKGGKERRRYLKREEKDRREGMDTHTDVTEQGE